MHIKRSYTVEDNTQFGVDIVNNWVLNNHNKPAQK